MGTDAKYCHGDVTTVHGSDLTAPTEGQRKTGAEAHIKPVYALADVYTKGALAGCIKKISFEPHLPTYELSVGDFVRVGDEYREIGALNQDTTSGNYSWAYVTERFNYQYAAGTPAFRKNAEQVIESALTNLANGAVMSASASKRVAGTQLKATFDVHTSQHHGTYFAMNKWGTASDPTVVDNVCTGDLIATNNYDLTAVGLTFGAQQYLRQVLKTETTAAAAVLAEGAGGANGASRLVVGAHNSFHKGHIEDTTSDQVVADIMPGVQNTHLPENTLFRSSGGIYEIQTDVDGDPTEFVCDNSGLRTSYIASSAGYVSRSEPQTVRFVDASYGTPYCGRCPLRRIQQVHNHSRLWSRGRNERRLCSVSRVGGHQRGYGRRNQRCHLRRDSHGRRSLVVRRHRRQRARRDSDWRGDHLVLRNGHARHSLPERRPGHPVVRQDSNHQQCQPQGDARGCLKSARGLQ